MQLLPHQIADAHWLAFKSPKVSGLYSGMGTGKTLTGIHAAILRNPCIAVIVGPPISTSMWKENWENETDTPAQILRTGKTPIDIVRGALIMSYEIATKRVEELKRLRPGVLILDESHACKSIKAKRTQAMLGANGLARAADKTWCLTGTPVTRHNDDLFAFMANADMEGLKERCGGNSIERFKLRYCVEQKRQWPGARFPVKMVVGSRNTDELNEWLFDGGLAIRRELDEVWAAMPPLTISNLTVRLDASSELKNQLEAVDKMTSRQLDRGLASNDENLSRIRRELGEAKVKYSAAEICDRVEAGNGPILVGAWHTDVIKNLAMKIAAKGKRPDGSRVSVGVIDGATPSRTRDELQKQFNAGDLDVLIGQIKACGVSLNLQGSSHHIVVVEHSFSNADMDQFYARLHRMGQQNHVHVDVFDSDTKLDKAIRRIAASKGANADRLVDQEETNHASA